MNVSDTCKPGAKHLSRRMNDDHKKTSTVAEVTSDDI